MEKDQKKVAIKNIAFDAYEEECSGVFSDIISGRALETMLIFGNIFIKISCSKTVPEISNSSKEFAKKKFIAGVASVDSIGISREINLGKGCILHILFCGSLD